MSAGGATLEASEPLVGAADSRHLLRTLCGVTGLALICAAHVPPLYKYVSALLALPHYEYILALPVFAGLLVHSRAWWLGPVIPGYAFGTAAFFLISSVVVAFAAVFDSPWMGAIAALWALMACCYAWGGPRFAWAVVPAWLVLWLMIRLPMESDVRLVQNLQSIAASRASVLLHLMGQPHILQGNIVETPSKRYAVEEACSGVQSLFAITACTVFFVLWSRMSWWRALLLLGVAWWWVWAANVARVVIVTYFNSNFDVPIDTGWMHDALGMLLFVLTMGLVYSSGRFLWFLFPFGIFGRRDGVDQEELGPAASDKILGRTSFRGLHETILASPWLVAFYLMVVAFLWLPQLRLPEASASSSLLNNLQSSFAPIKVGDWELVPESYVKQERSMDSQWGAQSQAWRYRNRSGKRELVVSLDYPFLGWHELATCYVNNGWSIDTRQVGSLEDSGVRGWAKPPGLYVLLRMRKAVENDFGMVAFQLFNSSLEPFPVPEYNLVKMLAERLRGYRSRLATLGASGGDLNAQTQSFQLQVMMQDHSPFSEQDEVHVRQLLAQFRVRLEKELSVKSSGASL